ncbi:type II toxin-antitoxin system RelE/ParE family toxin [Flavobacterium sp.]|jgi:plasmid stabilization system protein ParE|uniref:type II toxin-antitoxin system RelE/ParE family toxin n=1 Tax=Flavobacterium sp. TaxID=239 RepID=UPI0037BF1B49
MSIKFTEEFYFLLNEIVDFIATDKPLAARKFKKNLITSIKKDLKSPYNYKKSIYFDDIIYRDYVFKGYTITCKVHEDGYVIILGIIKNKNTY